MKVHDQALVNRDMIKIIIGEESLDSTNSIVIESYIHWVKIVQIRSFF